MIDRDTDSASAQRAPPALLLPRPRRSGWGLGVSIAFHAALVLLVVGGVIGGAERLLVGAGSGAGPAGGGGSGGDRVSYIELPPVGAPAAAAAATEVVDAPVVVPPLVEEAPQQAQTTQESVVSAAPAGVDSGGSASGAGGTGGTGGTGGGTGGGQGPGTGVAIGPGTGGDSTDIAPPQLRNWVPPMERPPKELRGRTIRVTFWVTVDGRVEKFETDPEIRDRDYLEKFSEIVMKTRFRPARTRAGAPVAVVFPMDFILSTGS